MPTVRILRTLTVAAFAVCIQSFPRPIVSKLPSGGGQSCLRMAHCFAQRKQVCRIDIPAFISFSETVLSTMSLRWHYPNQVIRSGLTARSQPARAGSLLVMFFMIALKAPNSNSVRFAFFRRFFAFSLFAFSLFCPRRAGRASPTVAGTHRPRFFTRYPPSPARA